MERIQIELLSTEPHLSQVLTGFCMLVREDRKEYEFSVENYAQDNREPYHPAFLRVHYHGKLLIYDMQDGYQNPEAIRHYLERCDFYFKRSYSEEKNAMFGLAADKMYPLGFNYHVSCRNHPMDKPAWKETIKRCLGLEYNDFTSTVFSNRVFEEKPAYKKENFTVLFCTRLWGVDPALSKELNEERRYINQTRIDIIKGLRQMGGIRFLGGLPDTPLSREAAPDLVMAPGLAERRAYLKRLHESDICIGSMGLHESIGWKTGEYVAASKAIVNEKFHYSVPGSFAVGKNYLEFTTGDECLEAVRMLLKTPEKLYEMKKANQAYYQKYLRPDMLVRNTLKIVDEV